MSFENLEDDINKAVDVLRKGGIILYPTDTIWGIGCDSGNSEAVKRIYELKKRADSKSMIILTDSINNLDRYADVPEIAYELIEAAVDPMTVVYDNARNIAPELKAEDGSVAIRVTREEVSGKLCKAMRKPIVSTSANISGEKSPTNFCDIPPEIIAGVDYVMESGRECNKGKKASTIIKLSADGSFKIIKK